MISKLLLRYLVFAIAIVSFLSIVPVHASLVTGSMEGKVEGFTSSWGHGGSYSNGRKFVVNDLAIATLYVYNTVPFSYAVPVRLSDANAKITGFGDTGAWSTGTNYGWKQKSPCIVGNKLLVCDTDAGISRVIRIWNNVPGSDTNASSCDYKITGVPNANFNFLSGDDTRFCLNAYNDIYVWDSVPAGNTTVSASRTGHAPVPYGHSAWCGQSGRFYVTYFAAYEDTRYVAIFDTTPRGEFTMDSASAKIKLRGVYQPSAQTLTCAIEMRGALYVFNYDYDGNDTSYRVYIWKTIPSSNTDTSTANVVLKCNLPMPPWSVPYYGYETFNADTQVFYRWDSFCGWNVDFINNNYDITITSADVATAVALRNQKNLVLEKIRIYTNPGTPKLTSMRIRLTGNNDGSEIDIVKIYDDIDNDGVYTAGTDVSVCSGNFAGDSIVFGNTNFTVSSGDKTLLVCYDVAETATLSNTLGVSVEYMIFENNYKESFANLSSGLTSIVDSQKPAWNNAVTVNYTRRETGADTAYSIMLDWEDATSGMPPITYIVSHFADDVLTETFVESGSSKIISGLDISKKHKFKVKVVDSYDNQTQESNVAYDDSPPVWQGTFKIEDASRIISGTQWDYKIKISWDTGYDNTSSDILYEIWVKEQTGDWVLKESVWDKTKEITLPTGIYYIKMRCRDSAGNYVQYGDEKKIRMNPFLVTGEEKDIGPEGGTVTLTELEGDRVELEIPKDALKKKYGILAEKMYEAEYTYRFRMYDAGNVEKKIIFAKPVVIKFFYNDSKILRLGFAEKDLHVIHFDGVKWRNIGGELDANGNSVTVRTYTFSVYKVTGDRDDDKRTIAVYPETVTPNGDEINDALFFGTNWNYTGSMNVRVVDMTGKSVWEYNGTEKAVVWNCRDINGALVETGAYVYSIRIEGRFYNGTITVAR